LGHNAARPLGLVDTEFTGIDIRRRVNQDMPRKRNLPPDQQKYQHNAAFPLCNTHALILHQAQLRCDDLSGVNSIGASPENGYT
jgi:hypothetical protein